MHYISKCTNGISCACTWIWCVRLISYVFTTQYVYLVTTVIWINYIYLEVWFLNCRVQCQHHILVWCDRSVKKLLMFLKKYVQILKLHGGSFGCSNLQGYFKTKCPRSKHCSIEIYLRNGDFTEMMNQGVRSFLVWVLPSLIPKDEKSPCKICNMHFLFVCMKLMYECD